MIVLGRIAAPYGIKGWVKLHPFGDDPAAWAEMPRWWIGRSEDGGDWQPIALKELRAHGKGLIGKFDGVDDRTAAEKLDGMYVGAPREELPATGKDEFYWGDLVGLEVVNEAGESLGKVASLIEAGANQVLTVKDEAADKEHLLPFVAEVVKDVDLAGGRICVAWGKDW
ncbi:MAG: ribosome maturation factor RimM [Ignavibacteria bacterium]